MSFIADLAEYIETEGSSLGTRGTDLFMGKQPHNVADCVAIYEQVGEPQEKDVPLYNIGVQILVRNSVYATGEAKMKAVYDFLHQKANIELVSGQTYCYYVLAETSWVYLGTDEQRRHEWSLNLNLKVR